jgi:hypothetical protein
MECDEGLDLRSRGGIIVLLTLLDAERLEQFAN